MVAEESRSEAKISTRIFRSKQGQASKVKHRKSIEDKQVGWFHHKPETGDGSQVGTA